MIYVTIHHPAIHEAYKVAGESSNFNVVKVSDKARSGQAALYLTDDELLSLLATIEQYAVKEGLR